MSLAVWRIHGNEYDLTGFIDSHPGGRLILEQTRGIADATPLFESYHPPGVIDSVHRRLESFLIREDAYKCSYTFRDDGFYGTVRERVYAMIDKEKKNKKAIYSPFYWIKMIVSIATFGAGCIVCRHDMVGSFMLGMLYLSIGFNMMHDASHYAVCVSPRINQYLSMAWQAPIGWDAILWHSHHVVHHHSFTGSRSDPDLVHHEPLLYKVLSRNISIAVWDVCVRMLILMLFVMYLGQMIVYNLWDTRGVIFNGLPYPYKDKTDWIRKMCFLAVLCGVVACTPLLSVVSFVIGANVAYAVNIFCNHDTLETYLNAERHADKEDWGERQVLESANWGGRMWCHMFGGINYQIEHHLFPSIYHGYYPVIAPIVREACEEFGIPYAHYPTILHALAGFTRKMIHINHHHHPKKE